MAAGDVGERGEARDGMGERESMRRGARSEVGEMRQIEPGLVVR
jgi:hypothetical protein